VEAFVYHAAWLVPTFYFIAIMAMPVISSASQELDSLLSDHNASILQAVSSLCSFIHREVWLSSGHMGSQGHQTSPGWTTLYRLIPLVMDRLYGEVHRSDIDVQCDGGWMFAATRFYNGIADINAPSVHPHPSHHGRRGSAAAVAIPEELVGMSKEAIALVRLLKSVQPGGGGAKLDDSLFHILRMKHSVSFTFAVAALPVQSQKLLQHSPLRLVCHNARLYSHCLAKIVMGSAGGEQAQAHRPQQLMLTMEEMYFFIFAQYAVVTTFVPPPRYSSSNSQSQSRPARMHQAWVRFGVKGLTKGNPYNTLVIDYAKYFFPHAAGRGGEGGGDWMGLDAELFLRSLAEFWLCQTAVVSAAPGVAPIDSVIFGDYAPPADMALHGLLVLVTHLLADPALERAEGALTPALALLQPQVFEFLRLTFNTCSLRGNSTAFALAVELWLLWLQPWTARGILNGGSPASGGKRRSSVGVSLVESFALHHSDHHTGGGGVAASVNLRAWRGYVTGSSLMYTLLLASFVRRARDLSFVEERQPGEIGVGARLSPNVSLVERVLQVFSPDLIFILDACRDGTGCTSALLASVSAPLPALSSFRGDACSLLEEMAAQSRDSEKHGVLTKTIGLVSTGVTKFKHAVGTDTTSAQERIAAAARLIFDIPQNWAPTSTPAADESGEAALGAGSMVPERKSVFLTAAGRQQIAQGRRVCSKVEASYIGDPMLRPTETYEIAWLAHKLVTLSMHLNRRYGLDTRRSGSSPTSRDYLSIYEDERPSEAIIRGRMWAESVAPPKHILGVDVYLRFNLRFLADYRNLLFIVLASLCLRLIVKLCIS
jgi:hypothetical protein